MKGQCRWPCARLMGSQVRIPLRVRMFSHVSAVCCAGSGLCDWLVALSNESSI